VTNKHRIDVSPEMLAFCGPGALDPAAWPEEWLLLAYTCGSEDSLPFLSYRRSAESADALADGDIVLAVDPAACVRLFGQLPPADADWHLPRSLRGLAVTIRDGNEAEAVRDTLRLARCIELLCQTFTLLARSEAVPLDAASLLNEVDAARIARARQLIDERWSEKLTLDSIARACGLNRDKLARGFRALYRCSVADRLSDNRLLAARELLLVSELPVSTIAYRCGYLNNASFTRAFNRRFGAAPSQLRQGAIAA
jgi:AraC family transcriptional regulator, transcriptional activator of the genes for pyochelin and ferripyochelin receptors